MCFNPINFPAATFYTKESELDSLVGQIYLIGSLYLH